MDVHTRGGGLTCHCGGGGGEGDVGMNDGGVLVCRILFGVHIIPCFLSFSTCLCLHA